MRYILLILVLSLIGIGCHQERDLQLPDGSKVFGELRRRDGTLTIKRQESPDGSKAFDVTKFPDGRTTIARKEFSDQVLIDETVFPDGTMKIARRELSDGAMEFNLTVSKGTEFIERTEANGQSNFNVTRFPDGRSHVDRTEFSNGEKRFNITLSRGKASIGRMELPNGQTLVNMLQLPDGRVIHQADENGPAAIIGRSSDNLVVGGIQTGATFQSVNGVLVENGYHEIHTPDSDPNYQRLVGRCTLGQTARSLSGEAGPPNLSCTSFGTEEGGYELLFVRDAIGDFRLVQFRFYFPETVQYQQAEGKLQEDWGTPTKAGADWARWEVGRPYVYQGVPTHSLQFLLDSKEKSSDLLVQDIRLGDSLVN